MEVIVKSSPKIEIEFATKVVKVGGKVTVDSALSTTSENPVMNKVVTEKLTELSEKIDNLPQGDEFDKDGNYPLLHVGTADDLAGRGESVPASFGFRASGGKSIKDGRAYIKAIKGNSVVWNQTINFAPSTQTINGVTYTINNDGTITMSGVASDSSYVELLANNFFMGGHKYALTGGFTSGNSLSTYFLAINKGGAYTDIASPSVIFTADIDKVNKLFVRIASGVNTNGFKVYPKIYDLTKMFGSGNEPNTIDEFNARVATLGVDMNAYNEGQVIHCNTESIKSVGDNAWDEEWENGTFNTTTGDNINTNVANKSIRCKNPIPVVAGEEYYSNHDMWVIYETSDHAIVQTPTGASSGNSVFVAGRNRFTIPTNVAYMRFYLLSTYGTTYNHDIMISLVHSGWKQDTDAGYQPYWQDTLPLPIIRKYFPDGMKKAGSAHDEIRYNKVTQKWEAVQRIGEAKLWELNGWVRGSSLVFIAPIPDMMPSLNINNGIMAEYNLCSSKNGGTMMGNAEDKSYITNGGAVGGAGKLAISDTAYNDVDSFVAHLEEVQAKLYYELAKPIVTELDAEDQNFRDYYQVADFGTEQSQSSVPSAAFSADIIYQFNAVDMIREHELEITELQSIIATMQAQLTALTNGGQ